MTLDQQSKTITRPLIFTQTFDLETFLLSDTHCVYIAKSGTRGNSRSCPPCMPFMKGVRSDALPWQPAMSAMSRSEMGVFSVIKQFLMPDNYNISSMDRDKLMKLGQKLNINKSSTMVGIGALCCRGYYP